ncbi:tyrosine-type recombinase/integrase [Paraburkholderia phenazinium]|uniref:tyrosine-type recombinase/integrase n=1 Tax=Paraburkholderia phenazinium TaxID=60549 RepID=UPI001588F45A|nr:site-specific integrase [Paraburkholderia phenazinium]
MATNQPFREGTGWAFRTSIQGRRIYQSGFPTEAAARRALASLRAPYEDQPVMAGQGPFATTVAQAWLTYASERLPSLKGARQDANRINRYLREAGLPVIELGEPEIQGPNGPYHTVRFERESGRLVMNSLQAHRAAQSARTLGSDALRRQLAMTPMAKVTAHQLQALVDMMVTEGLGAATIALERAEWRRLFTYARKKWNWHHPVRNPAGDDLSLPSVDNARDRVLTNSEWQRLLPHLVAYDNRHVLPVLCLMLETAMRSCEPLTHARWGDVQWSRCVLALPRGKTGKRDVPLNPAAIALLVELKDAQAEIADDAPLFPGLTYEQMKKAWRVACAKAGIENVKAHDLRHTSATRYAHEFNGNLPVIMQITGHKTIKMAMRYINITSDDVVQMMHGDDGDVGRLPAGYRAGLLDSVQGSAGRAAPRRTSAAEGSPKTGGPVPELPPVAMDVRVVPAALPAGQSGAQIAEPASAQVIRVDFRRHAA